MQTTKSSSVRAGKSRKQTSAKPLEGKVAVVAGASRGAGKGIALALGDAGATVYVTGRTTRANPKTGEIPGTIDDTADEVSARGGVGIPLRADYTNEADVAAVFDRVQHEHGKLHLLANAVWGGGDAFNSMEDWQKSWSQPFWEQPLTLWHHMMNGGPHAYLLASIHAARIMAASGGGLIVGVTDGIMADAPEEVLNGAITGPYQGAFMWTLAHEMINRMMYGMSCEAKAKKIAMITLMPGFMRTETVVKYLNTDELRKAMGFEKSETTEYIGRAIAHLAADPKVLKKTGRIHFVADLAREYGFTDVDGKQVPRFSPFG
jgi:NAD(P)-dependent dehydrogenase (short-subunit alcohol dehydrogenase family)